MEDNLFEDIEKYLSSPKEKIKPEFQLLTDEEVDYAIVALVTNRGDEGATEDELVNFIKWLEMARLNNALANLFFKGLIKIDDATGTFAVLQDDNLVISATNLGEKLKKELQ